MCTCISDDILASSGATRSSFERAPFSATLHLPVRYQWFGEVFDQAIQMGLPAIQTQHPGLYFEQAALHGRRRRQAADALPLVSGQAAESGGWDLSAGDGER